MTRCLTIILFTCMPILDYTDEIIFVYNIAAYVYELNVDINLCDVFIKV